MNILNLNKTLCRWFNFFVKNRKISQRNSIFQHILSKILIILIVLTSIISPLTEAPSAHAEEAQETQETEITQQESTTENTTDQKDTKNTQESEETQSSSEKTPLQNKEDTKESTTENNNKQPVDESQEENPMTTGSSYPGYGPGSEIYPDPLKNIGGLEGKYETSLFTGAATYNYSLTLPPGRNGLTPQIALQYNSHSRENGGFLGYGWNLTENFIQRSDRRGVNTMYVFNEFEAVIGGSQKTLIQISSTGGTYGEYGEQAAEYFWKYTFNTNNSWTIKDKLGTTYTFGYSGNARQDDPSDNSRIYRWYLEEIRDTNDNFIRFTYYNHSEQLYPDTIYYTGHGSTDGPFRIEFGRENRTDPFLSYRQGFRVETQYRMNEIRIYINGYGNGGLVKKYNVGYTTGDNGTRSLLTTISETGWGKDGISATLPSTRFIYSNAATDDYYDWEPTEASNSEDTIPFEMASSGSGGDYGNKIADLNGDGFTDVFASQVISSGCDSSSSCTMKKEPTFYISNRKGGWDAWRDENSAFQNFGITGSPIQIMDINGDLLDDVYRPAYTRTEWEDLSGYYINIGGKWVYPENMILSITNYIDKGERYADINGDGFLDILQHSAQAYNSSGGTIKFNDGYNLFQQDTNWVIPVPMVWDEGRSTYHGLDSGARLIDINSDGLTDIVMALEYDGTDYDSKTDETIRKIYINNGKNGWVEDSWFNLADDVFAKIYQSNYASYWSSESRSARCFYDFNGDGLIDEGVSPRIHNGTSWQGVRARNIPGCTASGSFSYSGERPIEVNGDGISDEIYTYAAGYDMISFSKEASPDILQEIQTKSGASMQISYTSSAQMKDTAGQLQNTGLPLVMQLVTEVEYNDGFGNISSTRYQYKNGRFYRYDKEHKEFAGFSEVTVVDYPKICAKDPTETLYRRSSTGDIYVVDCNYLRRITNFEDSGFLARDIIELNGSEWEQISAQYSTGINWDEQNHSFIYEEIEQGTTAYKELIKKYTFDQGCRSNYPCSNPGLYEKTIYEDASENYWIIDGGYKRSISYNEVAALGYHPWYKVIQDSENILTQIPQGSAWNGSLQYFDYLGAYTLKGKPLKTETWIYDSAGALKKHSELIQNWEVTTLGSNRFFPKLTSEISINYENGSSHRDTATTYEYDTNTGNITVQKNYGEVSANPETKTFSNIGSDELFTYTDYASNTSAWIVGLPMRTTITDASITNKADILYYYDSSSTLGSVSKGNLTKESYWLNTSGNYLSTTYTYNSYGNRETMTNPRGYTANFSYDTYFMYPTSITNAKNQTTSFAYNYFHGKVETVTDPNGGKQAFSYDPFYRLKDEYISDPSSASTLRTKTTYEYNDSSFPTSLRIKKYDEYGAGPFENWSYYDGFKRAIQTRTEGENYYSVIDTSYDKKGNIQQKSIAYFAAGSGYATPSWTQSKTTYEYDEISRPIKVSFLKSDGSTYAATSYNYSTPWQTAIIDPENNIKRYRNDAFGRLTEVDEILDGTTYTTRYSYDTLGNFVGIIDSQGNVKKMKYDSLSRLKEFEDIHASSNINYGIWYFSYDNNGNVITQTDPKEQTINNTYDEIDRIKTESLSGGSTYTYVYDTRENGIGRLSQAYVDANVLTEYSYDAIGNIKQEIRSIEDMTFMTDFSTDIQGRPRNIIYPDGNRIDYGYDGNAGFLETVTKSGTAGNATIVSAISYSPMGQTSNINYGTGAILTNTFDSEELYRLRSKITTKGATNLQYLGYTHNKVGNIKNITDSSYTASARSTNYSYDNLYRLKTGTSNYSSTYSNPSAYNYSQSYNYDAIGNMTYRSDVGNYSYTGTGFPNPHAATTIGSYNISYDRNGNMEFDGQRTLVYNQRNLIKQATYQGKTSTFLYDHGNNRVLKRSENGEAWYPNQFYELRNEGGFEKAYSYIFAGNTRIATLEGVINFDEDGDGYRSDENDCDDGNPAIHPAASETCDGIDNNCSGSADEGLTYDSDGDGYSSSNSCQGTRNDCNDSSSSVHPGATEQCSDGIDQDCNGSDLSCAEVDLDGDGYNETQGDCDETNPAVHPGATEICSDGVDQDCNGVDLSCDEVDGDNDGWTPTQGDCEDNNPAIYPNAEETCDGIDNNCSGDIDEGLSEDEDGDGHSYLGSCGGTSDDCDDNNDAVYPDADEQCNDEIDNDCDGLIDTEDECVNPDTDNDGVEDTLDNCPETSNPDQSDGDNDGAGDLCDKDLRIHYTFTPTSDELEIFDESPYRNHGKIDSSRKPFILTSSDWAKGYAAFFDGGLDGTSDNIWLQDNDSLSNFEGITASAWIYPLTLSNKRAIMSKYETNTKEWTLYLDNGAIALSIHANDSGCENTSIYTIADEPITYEWTHVAGSYDGQNVKLFVNGKEIETIQSQERPTGTICNTDEKIRLGISENYDNDFFGYIDEVKLYNMPLSQNQICENTMGYVWDAETQGCIPSDFDGDGSTINDGDCNDKNPSISPNAPEDCFDEIDNDCDGLQDYDDPACTINDQDGDGVMDDDDNCPAITNTDQRDTDADGMGNVCDADMRIHYTFTPTENTNEIWDDSGYKNHGTIDSSRKPQIIEPEGWTHGYSAHFDGGLDGSSDNIWLNDNDTLSKFKEISVSAWIKPEDLTESRTVLSKFGSSNGEWEWNFYLKDGYLYFLVNAEESGCGTKSTYAYADKNLIEQNKWVHVAATYDGTKIKLYINGAKRRLNGQTTMPTGQICDTTTKTKLGISEYYANDFIGYMDDITVYNYTRTEKQICEEDGDFTWLPFLKRCIPIRNVSFIPQASAKSPALSENHNPAEATSRKDKTVISPASLIDQIATKTVASQKHDTWIQSEVSENQPITETATASQKRNTITRSQTSASKKRGAITAPKEYKLYYHFQDHLGNTALTTDADSNIVEVIDYKPFGEINVRETYGDYKSSHTYNDKENDPETDLYYYGQRYYDGGTSKFTSIDPALFGQAYLQKSFTDPQKLNSYSYAKNNPTFYIDPLGLYNVETGEIEEGDTTDSIVESVNEALGIETTWAEIVDVSFFDTDDISQLIGQFTYVGTKFVTDITSALDQINVDRAAIARRENFGYLDLIDKFYSGHEWDLKNLNNMLFGSIKIENKILRIFYAYIYKGALIRYDAPGNINFGYVAKSIGIKEKMIKTGAAVEQFFSDIIHFKIPEMSDNPGDWEYIKQGYNLSYQ